MAEFFMNELTDVMKYKIILISALVLIYFTGFGQNPGSRYPTAEMSFSYDYLEDFQSHFILSYTFNRHEPFIGFQFPINSNPVNNFGGSLGYKFYPNENRPAFDVFFLYMMQANSRKLHSTSTFKGFSLHNLVGYGFNIRLHNLIYLNHHVAAGFEHSWFGGEGNFTDISLQVNLGVCVRLKRTNNSE